MTNWIHKICRGSASDGGQPVRRQKGFARNERGAAAVELALTLPLFLAAVFGVIEVGRLIYTQAALSYAAEEATRYAVVNEGSVTTTEIEAYAAARLIGVIDSDTAVFSAAAPLDVVSNTSLFTVTVSYPYDFMLPYVADGAITLSASSTGFLAFQ